MQGREKEIETQQSEDPSPTLPISQKMREQQGQQKGIGPALETRQSHTIKYGVNQIVPDTERGIKVL